MANHFEFDHLAREWQLQQNSRLVMNPVRQVIKVASQIRGNTLHLVAILCGLAQMAKY